MNIEDFPEYFSLVKTMGASIIVDPYSFTPIATLLAANRRWTIAILKDNGSIQMISDEEDNIILREYFYGDKFIKCYFEEIGQVTLSAKNYNILNKKRKKRRVL